MTATADSRRGWGRRHLLPGLLLLGLLLAACRTAPPPPPPPADTVVATSDPAQAVASFSLAPGETKDFKLQVPAAILQSADVLYLELDPSQPGVLELRGTTYWYVIASSVSADRFVSGPLTGVPQPTPGAAGANRAGEGAGAQAVVESRACLGPCVIFAPTTTTYYARVVNDTGATMTAALYLYGYDLQDDTEPQNDARSTAPVLETVSSGAIELLGDTDFWLAPAYLQATVSQVSGGVDITAVVADAGGVVVAGPYASGEAFEVYRGEFVRVRAATGTAAAPAKSSYFIETANLPGDPSRPPTYLEVTANNSGAALDQRTVPAGGMIEYRLIIPATVRSRDVLYVELDTDLGLEFRTSSNLGVIASSSSSNGFSSGGASATIEQVADSPQAQAITAAKSCRGSCVIVVPTNNSHFVRVYGGASNASFTLYAYGSDLMDSTEPANDSTATAPVLVDDDGGAIETIGDVDAWLMGSTGTVAFDTVSGGPALQAQVLASTGVPVPPLEGGGPFFSGESFDVFGGEYIRVSASDPSQAAAADRSGYFLERTGGLVSGAASRRPAEGSR